MASTRISCTQSTLFHECYLWNGYSEMVWISTWIILGMGSPNERKRYYVTLSLIGRTHIPHVTQQVNDRCRNVKFKISNYKRLRTSQAISQTSSGSIWGLDTLTYWSPNHFLCMKIFVYLFKCHWSLSVALGAIDGASVGSGNDLVPSATDVNQHLRPHVGNSELSYKNLSIKWKQRSYRFVTESDSICFWHIGWLMQERVTSFLH